MVYVIFKYRAKSIQGDSFTIKSYWEYVRRYRNQTTQQDRLKEAISRLNEEQSTQALNIINAILAEVIG